MREVGRRIFDCTVRCKVIQKEQDIESLIVGVDGETFKEYVRFEVRISENCKGDAETNGEQSNGVSGQSSIANTSKVLLPLTKGQ